MENIEIDKLKTLLEIIGTNPSVQVAHFSSGGEELIETINNYCASQEYLYQINVTSKPFYELIKEKFEPSARTVVHNFSLERKSYMIQAKQYDYLFVSMDIEDEFMDTFLKRVHKIIVNAGNILIFIPKDDNMKKRYKLIASLEENYFVATSVIDDMFENYDVVISKKMHGWGG